jgi:hypothetical protein
MREIEIDRGTGRRRLTRRAGVLAAGSRITTVVAMFR